MHSQFAPGNSDALLMAIAEAPTAPERGAIRGEVIPFPTAQDAAAEPGLTHFQSHFVGTMALQGDVQTVMNYLDAHRGWFCRCAHPMQVEPVETHGYILTIGHFGAHGFEVEPKIGLRLLPQEAGIYRIETIPVVSELSQVYEVDFQAELQLLQSALATGTAGEDSLTQVEWQLDLTVAIQFPRFIHRLPKSLIQGTGDALLARIVRQVSRRLTARVQDDFHQTLGITPLQGRRRRVAAVLSPFNKPVEP
ncbi:DUF1997 domain-containing protein [Synechococcales cyanobacterium C]|uniref:DUF1997 domain-containing protein n=1 Tax=Petrachloros mirabilis ULC683 TaxID=2781853 RepID=A0A8K1ZWW4_9CYAN|nr:DUF1997 domain-containing protein [Petrachloros mirabilis]NCJ05608.1 DUF1997 domain-containing protein [Petrachloros mirabilis ULC683]